MTTTDTTAYTAGTVHLPRSADLWHTVPDVRAYGVDLTRALDAVRLAHEALCTLGYGHYVRGWVELRLPTDEGRVPVSVHTGGGQMRKVRLGDLTIQIYDDEATGPYWRVWPDPRKA